MEYMESCAFALPPIAYRSKSAKRAVSLSDSGIVPTSSHPMQLNQVRTQTDAVFLKLAKPGSIDRQYVSHLSRVGLVISIRIKGGLVTVWLALNGPN